MDGRKKAGFRPWDRDIRPIVLRTWNRPLNSAMSPGWNIRFTTVFTGKPAGVPCRTSAY
ncbi:hypothetical protein YDYSY3_24580 [Paenibacillus chitinolyticus]|nr:hypothetical protein YDYSY3_24580 [Paenibacillus chitinolyticus]